MEETLTLSKDNLSILLHTPSSPSSRQTRDCEPQSHLSYRQLSWGKEEIVWWREFGGKKATFLLMLSISSLLSSSRSFTFFSCRFFMFSRNSLITTEGHLMSACPDKKVIAVICCSCSIDFSKENHEQMPVFIVELVHLFTSVLDSPRPFLVSHPFLDHPATGLK